MSLPPQAWVGHRRPRPDRFEAPTQRIPTGWAKPIGGMWTSTYDERGLSDWCQWCLSNEFRIRRDQPVFQVWELKPDKEAKVFVIDGRSDLETLIERYPAPPLLPNSRVEFPDWERVADDFDAIHLTKQGQIATHLEEPNLYGWDCESTLWLRWSFAEITYRGLVWVPERDLDAMLEEVLDAVRSPTMGRL